MFEIFIGMDALILDRPHLSASYGHEVLWSDNTSLAAYHSVYHCLLYYGHAVNDKEQNETTRFVRNN